MIDINELYKNALKNKNSDLVDLIKEIKCEITLLKTSKNFKEYNESEEIKIINKIIKRKEAILNDCLQADREDLISKCRSDLEILKKFLPEPVKESEIYDFITQYAIDKNWVKSENDTIKITIPKKSMGEIIKATKTMFPTADGKIISDFIKLNLE